MIAFAAVLARACCPGRVNPSRLPLTEVTVYLLDLSTETSCSSSAIRAMA